MIGRFHYKMRMLSHPPGCSCSLRFLPVEPSLGRFHIPVRERVPEEFVQHSACRAKVHPLLSVCDLIDSLYKGALPSEQLPCIA